MVWAIDRLGRSIQHLVGFMNDIQAMGVDLFVMQQAIDTTTPSGRMIFSIFSALGPYLEERSTLSPVAVRRITIISSRPASPMGMPVSDMPIMNKLSSAYDAYRTSLMLQTEGLMKAAFYTPEIMSMVNDVRGVPFEGNEGVVRALSMVPLAYFASAYWDHKCGCGMSDEEFVAEFIRCNPELSKYLSEIVARKLNNPLLSP